MEADFWFVRKGVFILCLFLLSGPLLSLRYLLFDFDRLLELGKLSQKGWTLLQVGLEFRFVGQALILGVIP